MTLCSLMKLLFLLTLGATFLVAGCGKKARENAGRPDVSTPELSEVEKYMEKQSVSCEGNQACPNYLVKIVVVKQSGYDFCTGFLTDSNTIATSATCLPVNLRVRNSVSCSREIFFFFPKTANREAERAGCDIVIQSSNPEGADPNLWRDDVAFLKTAKEIPFRRYGEIARDGFVNGKTYTSWIVDQQDEYQAVVKRVNCEALHQTYVNPLVRNESSPGMLFSGCLFTRGATGAPIIDGRRIRGVVSVPMRQALRDYLLKSGLLANGLKEMFHATNFACAATPDDSGMLDERECRKDLKVEDIDRIRSEGSSTNIMFGDLRRKYEASLVTLSKYLDFGVKIIPEGDLQKTEIYPKCFKPFKGWLESLANVRNVYVEDLNLPSKNFRRSMDPNARFFASVIDGDPKKTYFQFSLKSIRANMKSIVLTWTNRDDVRTLPGALEECSPVASTEGSLF